MHGNPLIDHDSEISKRESITIRCNAKILNAFKHAAKKEGISLNSYINKLFSDFMEWDMISDKTALFLPMNRNMLKNLIDRLDENAIQDIGENYAEEAKDTMFLMTGMYDFDTWHSLLTTKMKKSGFNYKEYHNNGELTIIVEHRMGKKWSILYRSFYEKMLYDLGKQVKFDYTSNSLVFHIKLDNGQ